MKTKTNTKITVNWEKWRQEQKATNEQLKAINEELNQVLNKLKKVKEDGE